MTDKQKDLFDEFYEMALKVRTAWNLKKFILYLWGFSNSKSARWFFINWHEEVYKCKLPPMNKVADMLRKNLEFIMNYLNIQLLMFLQKV